MDVTVDTLTGATIRRCTRRGVCLELDTDKGIVIVGASHVFTNLRCMGCGEERLVEVIDTAGRQEAVCGVCARSWKLDQR